MTCEKCTLFVVGKCTDKEEFVNRFTGEAMCRYNSDAISRAEYEESQASLGETGQINVVEWEENLK